MSCGGWYSRWVGFEGETKRNTTMLVGTLKKTDQQFGWVVYQPGLCPSLRNGVCPECLLKHSRKKTDGSSHEAMIPSRERLGTLYLYYGSKRSTRRCVCVCVCAYLLLAVRKTWQLGIEADKATCLVCKLSADWVYVFFTDWTRWIIINIGPAES